LLNRDGAIVRDQILLHVEDEDVTAFLLESVLSESDPQVRVCRVSDGEEALAFLHQTGKHSAAPRPDLVLLDLGLPHRTGFEVLAEIRGNTGLRSLPVVVFSSSSLPSDKLKSLELGALDFITKRPSVQGMTEAIRQVCAYFPKQLS
jgi:chemotaxis family two-component system response regulator Rcp1